MAPIQADATPQSRRWQQIRSGLAGLWLLFLYALFSTFVVLSFSAYQLQTTIHEYRSSNGKSVELWSVKDLYASWKANADQLAEASTRYRELSTSIGQKYISIEGSSENIAAIFENCRRDIRTYINGIYDQILPFDSEYANILQRNIDSRNFCKADYVTRFLNDYKDMVKAKDATRNYLASLRVAQADAALDVQPTESKAEKVYRIVDGYNPEPRPDVTGRYLTVVDEIMGNVKLNLSEIDRMNTEKLVAGRNIEVFQKQVDLILAAKGGNFDDAIGNYLISFSYFDDVEHMPYLGRVIPDFSKMPPDTLTLILVLAMGALGGTIQLSRRHLASLDTAAEQGPIPINYYVFRPFLGAITALSIFILVKAGVLVASTPSTAGDTANLSPFFISFLAIVSGLLAEQALETLEQAGGNFFSKPKPPSADRWAFGLEAALRGEDRSAETYQQNIKDLARTIDVAEDQITKWAREADAVDEAHQKMIAAFFHLPARSLFTDIKA